MDLRNKIINVIQLQNSVFIYRGNNIKVNAKRSESKKQWLSKLTNL